MRHLCSLNRFVPAIAGLALLACSKSAPPEPSVKPAPAQPTPAPAQQPAAPAQQPAAPTVEPIAAGTAAPDFEMVAHDGTTVKMSALKGKPVVLYFYPKDETPGCIAEAEAFRDNVAPFQELGATIVGVSMDDNESHKAFATHYSLEYSLLPDTEGKIATLYGVDHSGGYDKRTTFVIGPDGKVFRTFPKVTVAGHDDEVLAAVKHSMGMD